MAALLGSGEAERVVDVASPMQAFDLLLLLLCLAGVWPLLRRARGGDLAAPALLVWLGFGLGPLLLGVAGVTPYYPLGLTPILGLCAGLALRELGRASRRAPAVLAALLALLCTLEALHARRLIAASGRQRTPHGVAVRYKLEAVQEVLDQDLPLGRYPSIEYLVLYHLEGRRRGLAHTRPYRVPYWGVHLELPVPAELRPHGYGAIFEGEPPAEVRPLERWRHGPLVVARTAAPGRERR
jgi:hypothetical protein